MLNGVYMYMYCLRWYGTPCNIYKDERILKYHYNHGFKDFNILNNKSCTQNALIKTNKKYKWCKVPATVRLLALSCPSNDSATQKVSDIVLINP